MIIGKITVCISQSIADAYFIAILPSDFVIIFQLGAAAIYINIIQWVLEHKHIIVRSIDGKSLREVLYHYSTRTRASPILDFFVR